MNKKLIYGLCAASFLMTACDYNEDNFPGFDQEPLTDVVYYEGEFTGKYPTEGYFSLVQGDEESGKATIEKALIEMLEDTYPYCDKGSSAKIKVKVADVMPSQEKEPAYEDAYELSTADYDAMGTGKNELGEHDNFSYNIDPNDYLPDFCAGKYADKAEGFICKIIYKYYSNRVTTTQAKYYKKGADGWTEEPLIPYDADKKYSLKEPDYVAMGTEAGEPGANDTFVSDEQADACLPIFLQNKYTYVAKEGLTVEVTYKVSGKEKKAIYRYNGSAWEVYNPKASIVVSITERITVMKFDGKEWKLSNLISDIKELSLTNAEYTKLVEWVKENKPEFMSTQNTTSEYYFGADTKNNNINNKYSTWTQYYNVDGYLNDLKDEEIQAIMDERLAKEAFPLILLPDMVNNPDPDISYTVIYKIYGGRGNGNYAMSFYYSKEDNTYTWDEMAPVMQ